jgi:hypothetical protein
MRILDPVLAPDVSVWCNHINPKEFEDAGCGSVVVGLYATIDSKGVKVLSPISRQQCTDVATKSSMVLQAYFWDDIIRDHLQQVEWLVQTVKKEGFPIKWVWVDQEQWWLDWTAWQQARGGKIPWSSVSIGSPAKINSHFENFNRQLYSQIPQSGVYTNNGFVSTWAPGMNKWLSQYRAWVPHYGRQPKEATRMTWKQLQENWMPNYNIALSAGQRPELVVGHQFTGDKCMLPGSYSQSGGVLPLDVNVFSKAFIEDIQAGDSGSIPAPAPVPQPAYVDYVVLYARINVRAYPSSTATWVRFAVKDEILHVVKIEYGWAQLLDGTHVCADYLGAIAVNTPMPPPSPLPQPGTSAYVVLHTRINVRAKPASDSKWVRFAVKDEVLNVVKIENGWAQLSDGTFVFADYIGAKQTTIPASINATTTPLQLS